MKGHFEIQNVVFSRIQVGELTPADVQSIMSGLAQTLKLKIGGNWPQIDLLCHCIFVEVTLQSSAMKMSVL